MADVPFRMSGQSGSRDKQNIVNWTIPYYVETVEQMFSVGATPPWPGLVEESREFEDIEGAGMQVSVTYEGYAGEDPEKEEPEYEFDSSFKEESLAKHPLWAKIAKFYHGFHDKESNTIKFDETIPSKKRGLGGAAAAPRANPMFGSETYLTFASVFRKTYLLEKLPSGLLDKVGTIVPKLPAGYPTPPGRDWLIMPPKVSQHGEVYRIAEELLLSPAGGWVEEVYGLIEI